MIALHKNVKILIITGLFLVVNSTFTIVLAAGSDNPNSIGKEYYPIDPTMQIVYESTFGETTCSTVADGNDFIQEFKSDDFEMIQRLSFVEDSYSVVGLQQEIDVFLFITHSVDVKYEKPAQMIALPLAKGEIWEWRGIEFIDENPDTLHITAEYMGEETIVTPAGEFECKKVNYVIKKSSGKITKYYEWRVPGVGLVKLEADLDPRGFAGMIQGLLGYDDIYFTLKSYGNKNVQ